VSGARRSASAKALTRAALAGATGAGALAPPVRIVHIGLGAFHRAHQAWYTDRAADGADWGIAAFTGRSAEIALELAPQDGLFTLIERAADGDTASVIASIAEAVDGADLNRLAELLSRSSTAIVTLTVTEAGYRLDSSGQPNMGDSMLVGDVRWLAAAIDRKELLDGSAQAPRTALGRVLLGLEARRRNGGGPLAIVPCDNVPGNGEFVARGLTAIAAGIDAGLAAWIEGNVAFVSTSVDRITPKTTPADSEAAAALTGWRDRSPVVTEPFRDWILSGEFPAGRPAWESAGARFVGDIEPFERRKLWLLNGAHSLLAYTGLSRGHQTVAQALADQLCLGWVNELWDEAARHLPTVELELDSYRAALLERFANPRIAYQLTQIATDGVAKLHVRIAPIVLAERAAGNDAATGIRALGTWARLVLEGADLVDTKSEAIDAARRHGRTPEAIDALIRLVEPRLLDDSVVTEAIRRVVADQGSA
jgi:fructuronate reductase